MGEKVKKIFFVSFWIVVQIILFVVPVSLFYLSTPYTIERDQYMLDISEYPMLNMCDRELINEIIGYDKLVLKLKNPELYYLRSLVVGFFMGLVLQGCNLLWYRKYDNVFW